MKMIGLHLIFMSVLIPQVGHAAYKQINFINLDQVSDNQIIYSILKDGRVSKAISEGKKFILRIPYGKCDFSFSSPGAGYDFKFIVKPNTEAEPANQLHLDGSIQDSGNQLAFVAYFRKQMKLLSCLKPVELPAQLERTVGK